MTTPEKYAQLSQDVRPLGTNNVIATFELLLQLLWLATGFYLSLLGGLFKVPGAFLMGTGFWRSFAILHAAGHGAFFTNRILNTLTGYLMSPFCLVPYHPWKYIHQDHHVWTGWVDRDPTTIGLLKRPGAKVLKLLNICWKLWLPVISLHYIFTMFFNPSSPSISSGQRSRYLALFSMLIVIMTHISLASLFGHQYVLILFPALFLYLNMGDLSLLTQHVHLPLEHTKGAEVRPKNLAEQDQYSHTMILPPFFTRWIALSFNHHSLHHLFPALPYYHSHKIIFEGRHTHDWKEWIIKAKTMKATDLIYHQR